MATAVTLKLDGDDSLMELAARISFTEAIDALDALVADFEMPSHADPTTAINALKIGAAYTVELSEDGTAVNTGLGDVVEVRHTRRPGSHRVTVVGLDGLHKLHEAHAPATVWEVAHDKIVKEIASRNSLTAEAEGVSGTAAIELQNEGSDALFLKRLARENNYYLRVVDTKLQFGRKAASGSAVKVDFDTEVMEITQNASVDGIVTKVTVHGGNYLQDETFTGSAASSDVAKVSGGQTGPEAAQAVYGARELIINQSGYPDASTATAVAKAELQRRADRFVRGSVWVHGRPDAVSGKKLTIEGAGWPLAGDFLIRQTTHVVVLKGYRTRIDFMSDSLPSAS